MQLAEQGLPIEQWWLGSGPALQGVPGFLDLEVCNYYFPIDSPQVL